MAMISRLRLCVFIFLCACVSPFTYADEPSPDTGVWQQDLYYSLPDLSLAKKLFLQGKDAYDGGQFEKAVDLFYQSLNEDPNSVLLKHYIGRAAYEMGDYEEALFSFERALVLDPNHVLSHLEKGRTHLALGSKVEAKEEFQKVLEYDLPAEVRTNVTNLLAEIDYRKRHYFSGAAILGQTWDSNATLGTGPVPLPFAPALLSDATQEPDQIATITLMGNHQYMLTEALSIRTTLLIYWADNHDLNTNDLRLYSLSSGLQGTMGAHMFDFTLAYMFLELNKQLYQTSERGTVTWYWKCHDLWMLKGYSQATLRHHYATSEPGIVNVAGLALQHGLNAVYTLCEKQQLYGEVTHYYDRSPDEDIVHSEYHRVEGRLGSSRKLGDLWSADAWVSYRVDQYRAFHSVYTDRKRHDQAWVASGTLTRGIGPQGSLIFNGEYVKNNSNIPTSDYEAYRGTISFMYLVGS
ncbi:MAG: tetratricopeptide repeat protein [Chlamydiia bacterium]|nr:tetratricopeptide repeat protein [Chlamydiia bacterium]